MQRLSMTAIGLLLCSGVAHAQYFTSSKGDLLAGFRKTGAAQGSYELVVNLGNITNFEAVAAGASIGVSNFSPSQLSTAFSTYNNLQWSVSAAFAGSSPWAGFPAATLWYTVPRNVAGSQTEAPARDIASNQQATRSRVLSVGSGAATISSGLGTTNANNNSVLVRESIGDGNALTAFIGDVSDPTFGDFQGTLGFTVENITPASFTSSLRSDLYQVCPSGTTDPATQLTTGTASFVGYFQLNTNGTMSFTRASTNAATPPAPTLSLRRSGTTNTISFLSTNGVTYTLYFADASALLTPFTNWSAAAGTLTGNNSVISFQDATTASDRIYIIHAQ